MKDLFDIEGEVEDGCEDFEENIHSNNTQKMKETIREVIEKGGGGSQIHLKRDEHGSIWVRLGYVNGSECDSGSSERPGAFVEPDSKLVELKEREQELEEKKRILELLNRILCHDIRNDIQYILAVCEYLEDNVRPETEEKIEGIKEHSEHAVELTEMVRKTMEVKLSDGSYELKPVDLHEEISEEVEEIRNVYDVSIDISELPNVKVKANDMLEAVFRNILKNAIDHNDKESPAVKVSVVEEDEYVIINIADNGPGIPDGMKEDIFGRGEKSFESGGTGMGLYLVRSLIEEYGGEVWVEDNDPTGTVFKLKLVRC